MKDELGIIFERIMAAADRNADSLGKARERERGRESEVPAKRAERGAYEPCRYALRYLTEGRPKAISRAFWGVQWWLNDILHRQKQMRRWCFLFGGNGVGKTHLALAARSVLKEHGRRSLYIRWVEEVEKLHQTQGGRLRMLIDIPVLFLDDVGKERNVGQGAECSSAWLFDLLDARVGRWTFITSNLSPRDFGEKYDTAIASRLYGSDMGNTIVDMSVKDYDFRLERGRADAAFFCKPF